MTTDTRKNCESALTALSDDMAAIDLFNGKESLVSAIKAADEIDPDALILARVRAHQPAAYNEERNTWDDFSQYQYENLKAIERELIPKAKAILKAALAA